MKNQDGGALAALYDVYAKSPAIDQSAPYVGWEFERDDGLPCADPQSANYV